MARYEGLALAPWGVLGQGRLRTDKEENHRRETGEKGRTMLGPDWERKPHEVQISRKLEEIAKEVGADHITAVAIAYVMHVCFPRSSKWVCALRYIYRKRLTCFQSWGDEKWSSCTPI